MAFEEAAFNSVVQGGPAWALLFLVYQQLKTVERKLDDVIEGIAYWGKRKKA